MDGFSDISRKCGESDYEWGYRIGYSDIMLGEGYWHHYSTEFCRGYRKGRDEIEYLRESVTEARYFR